MPDPCDSRVQPPWGQSSEHEPLPWHTRSQPRPGHDRLQGSDVTQKHIWPGVQLVEFVVWVVAMQAARQAPRRRVTTRRTPHG